MILRRLHELATRPGEGLLDDVAFEERPVPFIIQVAEDGGYLGIEERRGETVIPSRKKGAEPKRLPDRGKLLSVPRAHGNTAVQGFACLFCDTLARVLPLSDDVKSRRSRETFWKQIRQAAEATGDPALRAVLDFGRSVVEDDTLVVRVRARVEALKPGPGDRCTFAWDPDRGLTVVERDTARSWYRQFYAAFVEKKQQSGPVGVCQITGEVGPIPTSHPIKVGGVPGGLPAGVSLVSYDKPSFESYGLEGTANAGIGYTAADGYLRAVNALINNKLKDNPKTSLRVGSSLFLFWTRNPADVSDVMALDAPEPDQVARLLRSAESGTEAYGADVNAFYLLGLSGNSARAIVRGYLETTLPAVRTNLARWFRDLTIADTRYEGAGRPANQFPLWQLAAATAMESDRVVPDLHNRLVRAALNGDPLPDCVLAACVGRLRAEGSRGFRPERMALLKLTLLRRDIPVTETLCEDDTTPAYVCGQLMSVFEQIQYAALGDVNATVTDKFFGTFSAAPEMVLSRLYNNAHNHLRKLRGEKPGTAVALEKLLMEVSRKLTAPPNGQLSLRDQARFALGYYHRKAKRFEEIAARKAAKSDSTNV